MKRQLGDAIEFLRNREGLFLVLIGALLVQAPHTAEVFHRISTSKWWTPLAWLHSAGFAIVLELAVLLFVVRGRKELSWTFAGISVLMNVFYYYTPRWWTHPDSEWALMVECVVTSIALPLAIAFYSHEVAGKESPDAELPPVVVDATPTPIADEPTVQEVVAPDATPELREQIASLRLEGFDDKWIAINGLRDVTGATLAEVLGVNASTISRWRKAAQANGHAMEPAQ